MTLYEINQAIMDCIDAETGEVIDTEALENLQMLYEDKIEGIALWIKNLTAEAKAIAEEVKNLQARKKAAENKVESLKGYLHYALDGEKFKTGRVSISYRKSESVVVPDNWEEVPSEYLKQSDPTIDKVGIKKAIKAGIVVNNCYLEEKQNIQIR